MKTLKNLQNQVFTTMSALILCTSFIMVTGQLSAGVPLSAIVEIDPQGNMVAIWEESCQCGPVINASQRTFAGAAWSTPHQLSLTDSNSQNLSSRGPQLAINASGEAVAIWASTDPTSLNDRIYAATISLQGSANWTAATAVSDSNQTLRSPGMSYSVKLNANNQAVVLWQTNAYNYLCSTSIIGNGTNSWSTPATVVGTSDMLKNDNQ